VFCCARNLTYVCTDTSTVVSVTNVLVFSVNAKCMCVAGKLEIKEDNVENLLSTACLLQLDTVICACCSFLSKQLHPSNCLGIRQFADTQGCSQLYREANDYVVVS